MSTLVPGDARIPQQQQPQPPDSAPAERRDPASQCALRVRDSIHAVLCVLAGVSITIGFALANDKDADNGTELIAVVTEEPDRFYWSNTIGALGLVLVAATGLAVMRLVRGRGRVVATIGGLLLIIGGPAAAAGQFMYGAVITAMTESGQSAAVSAALQDSLEDSSRTMLPFVVGFPGIMLGLIFCAAALLMSRATPRWVPALLIAGVVGVFALGDTAAASLADVLLTGAFIGIALSMWKATAADATA